MSALRREAGDEIRREAAQDLAREEKKDDVLEHVQDKREARKKARAGSLDERIDSIEDRIDGHREALAVRTGAVGGKVLKTLSSPLVIVVAASAGFIFAQFRKRRRPERHARRDDREPVVVKPSLFASLTDALTLATTILAMLPLITRQTGKEAAKEAVDAHEEVAES